MRLCYCSQFPRNMFRGTAEAFATVAAALKIASDAVETGQDRETDLMLHVSVYLPFEHSQSLADQNGAGALIRQLIAHGGDAPLERWALEHRDIVERFGRFPHLNPLASTSFEKEGRRESRTA